MASNSAKQLSAAAGVAGVTASTQAEVQDKLEKSYASVSDANVLEIIHDCRNKTSHDPGVTAAAAPTTAAASTPSSSDASTSADAKGGGPAAFVGTWTCVGVIEIAPTGKPSSKINLNHHFVIVDNGDGTISGFVPEDHDNQCPPGRAQVTGSVARNNPTDPPCHKANGNVERLVSSTTTVSGNNLAINSITDVSGANSAQMQYGGHCTR